MDIDALRRDVEAVSTYYAERHGIARTDDWYMLKVNEEVGELTQAYLARSGQARDKGRSDAELYDDWNWRTSSRIFCYSRSDSTSTSTRRSSASGSSGNRPPRTSSMEECPG